MYRSDRLPHTSACIDGRWIEPAADAARFDVRNPATGEVLARPPRFGANATLAAVAAAARHLAAPPTREQRAHWLTAIHDALLSHQAELARIVTLENGKPIREAEAEIAYAAGFYGYYARHLHLLEPERLPERPRACTWTVHRRPVGVVGLITPWNFPMAMLAKKLGAAIGAGCPSVCKPANLTPLSVMALFTILEEVGLPPGFANLVIGDSAAIGQTLCRHPSVRLISFTGSTAVGQALAAQCADGVKRLSLELGGNAPYIVFADADLDAAADALIPNKFRANGQTCVCTNRVYVQAEVADAFTARVVARVADLTLGDPLRRDVDVGPLINRAGWEKVQHLVQNAIALGARRVQGAEAEPPDADWGCYYPPTVLAGIRPEMALCQEEIFGPVLPIASFHDEAQVLMHANNQPHGLAAYVHSADRDRLLRVAAGLRFGHVGLNTGTGPTPEAPFGGMKLSGYGREGGHDGLLEYTEAQTLAQA